ncbi:transglutaminase-like domain-containing protein [Maribacter sp. CXY002]|uniref:transglutaminase-like domain-containing protein n=1 Tax=Maribacter luteocoastalis TaxID=3407671 RepID=UPI003B672485
MSEEYTVTYRADNTYENWVNDAFWQFLIIPQENDSQELVEIDFSNSIHAINEFSINGYGFNTIRVHPKKKFKEISFEASFKLIKTDINPFDFALEQDHKTAYTKLQELDFKVNFTSFLKETRLTKIIGPNYYFEFNKEKSIFQNLQDLNYWSYKHLQFTTGVTNTNTSLDVVLNLKKGVCQDFAHLFCALARLNGIPARYVSGYLNQGNGYFGDSQMHAWVEAYVPYLGWLAFDPTNNILANSNHIKVCHGKDYNDCPPIKGVIYTKGKNKTTYSVTVTNQQQ